MTNFRDNTYNVYDNNINVLEISRQFNPGCANKMYNHEMPLQNKIFQPEHRYYEDVVFGSNPYFIVKKYHRFQIDYISIGSVLVQL